MARVRVGVYSIAKNEIVHVQRWVDATAGADYRVVVDTGSTDGTQEALKALGVDVYQMHLKPFRFDDARNTALSLVPEDVDVCLILDMDEVPEPTFFDKVRKGWKAGTDHGWISVQTGENKWERDRLHSRFGWRWKYPCHEVNVWYKGTPSRDCDLRNATIEHLPDNSKSRGQYLELLEMAVKEYPTDARMWTYMTREYFFYQKWQEVITSATKKLECGGWDVESAAVCRWAGEAAHQLGNEEDARAWYDKGANILPTQGEPWFGVAIDAYRKQEWQRCLDASLNAMERTRSNHYCYESAVWDWKAYDLAGISAYNLRHIDEAITFTVEALKANGPEQERIQRNLNFYKEVKNATSAQFKGPGVGL